MTSPTLCEIIAEAMTLTENHLQQNKHLSPIHFCEWHTVVIQIKKTETGSQTSEHLSLDKIYEIINFFN